MSTMSLEASTIRPRRASRWNQVKQYFVEWQQRARSRGELANLDEAGLQDISMIRSTAQFEASKPFWMA